MFDKCSYFFIYLVSRNIHFLTKQVIHEGSELSSAKCSRFIWSYTLLWVHSQVHHHATPVTYQMLLRNNLFYVFPTNFNFISSQFVLRMTSCVSFQQLSVCEIESQDKIVQNMVLELWKAYLECFVKGCTIMFMWLEKLNVDVQGILL